MILRCNTPKGTVTCNKSLAAMDPSWWLQRIYSSKFGLWSLPAFHFTARNLCHLLVHPAPSLPIFRSLPNLIFLGHLVIPCLQHYLITFDLIHLLCCLFMTYYCLNGLAFLLIQFISRGSLLQ